MSRGVKLSALSLLLLWTVAAHTARSDVYYLLYQRIDRLLLVYHLILYILFNVYYYLLYKTYLPFIVWLLSIFYTFI